MRGLLFSLALAGLSTLGAVAACTETEDPNALPPLLDASTLGEDDAESASPEGDGGGAIDSSWDDPGDASWDALVDTGIACDASTGCVLSSWWTCASGAPEIEACAYGCAASGCNTTCDEATVVVDQPIADDFTLIPPWQSFKLEETGVLTQLDLRPNVYSPTADPSTLTLSIYVGEGVAGTPIASQTYTVPSASQAPLTAFELTTPVPLQAEQTYTWQLTGANGLYFAKSDTYPHGRASAPSYDMVFKAHFRACH